MAWGSQGAGRGARRARPEQGQGGVSHLFVLFSPESSCCCDGSNSQPAGLKAHSYSMSSGQSSTDGCLLLALTTSKNTTRVKNPPRSLRRGFTKQGQSGFTEGGQLGTFCVLPRSRGVNAAPQSRRWHRPCLPLRRVPGSSGAAGRLLGLHHTGPHTRNKAQPAGKTSRVAQRNKARPAGKRENAPCLGLPRSSAPGPGAPGRGGNSLLPHGLGPAWLLRGCLKGMLTQTVR